ncbi:MAG: DNA mismatch repair endonuclease MutL [Candidatus Solibacter usitatus]|nr:DNA mismatch repair endonuclease MutL [Candidatus Solibacter usitatus]
MGRIRILSDTVANKIAAGEVVERPASVVKELLENSLDAGATDIAVETDGGGRRLIRVADNGCGMMRDDAMLAFERHATSKLSSVDQLEAIATLGFRGEALPSIASVSRLQLETRSAAEPTGARVAIAGGKLLACEEIPFAPGTTISVSDLFYNVPARKKFLRSEQTELAHIASLVTHYSLAHPQKSFELTHSSKELLRVTPVTTDRDRVFQVFGAGVLEDLVEIGMRSVQDGRFRLSGFVSRPQVQKSNRNSIFLFVNRRLIRDRLLLHAISAAYHNLIPPACYPFALLFIDCAPAEVDVNVHPSKTEVRFRNGSFVHDFVRDAIRDTIIEQRPVPSAPPPGNPLAQAGAHLPYSEFTQAIENFRFDEARPVSAMPPEDGAPLPEYTLRPAQPPPARFDFGAAPPLALDARPPAAEPLRLKIPDTHGGFPEGVDLNAPQGMVSLDDLRVLGQIHDSFIIAAGRDGLWIIDQHVAHERILFEKVLAQQAAGRVEQQRLLMPMVLPLTPAQQVEYDRIADELERAGFETEPFGNRTIAIKAAPCDVAPGDLERAIYEILEIAEGEFRKSQVEDFRRGIAASLACRAAIKINTRLDQAKMDYLLRELSRTRCPMSCPHGRPVALRYTTREILRSFHRI